MKEKIAGSIEKLFRKKVKKDPNIHNAYLLVHSKKLGLHLKVAEGQTGKISSHPEQPYYIASVSKLFASVLIAILVEKKMCSYEDHLSLYLDQVLLQHLHVYKGRDYSNEIKIKHLLKHSSGLHDFMEDKPKHDKTMIHKVLQNPSHSWSPLEVLQWAKDHLEPHFPPGAGFHYSDTGYHLLGMVIERITSKPYHEVLLSYLFEPLQMKHSFLSRSIPIETSKHPVANLYLEKVNVTEYESLSVVYAGGGIISTTEDLLLFMKSLANGKIIRKDSLETLKKDSNRFFLGIDYGYGIMNIKTVPFFMPSKYNAWGNAGSTGSFMFYHPSTDSHIIGSLNHFGYGQKGIRLMLQIIHKLARLVK